jgi:hypothetical protein
VRGRGKGKRPEVKRETGDEEVHLVGRSRQPLIGPAELVAIQAGEGILGDDAEPDLVETATRVADVSARAVMRSSTAEATRAAAALSSSAVSSESS